jgi:virulence-associated protein VagC
MTAVAKVFKSGNSQAIRIPKEFRVTAKEVVITGEGDRLIITPKPERESWEGAVNEIFGCCPDFDTGREKINDQPRRVTL